MNRNSLLRLPGHGGPWVLLHRAYVTCCGLVEPRPAPRPLVMVKSCVLNSVRTQRMIQHRSQCAVWTQHVSGWTLCAKCEVLQLILKPYCQHKMCEIGYSRFILTACGYLWLWSFVPSSQKWIRLLNCQSYFSFRTPIFPIHGFQWLMLAVTTIVNTSSLRNAWHTGLDTSSGSNQMHFTFLFLNLFMSDASSYYIGKLLSRDCCSMPHPQQKSMQVSEWSKRT